MATDLRVESVAGQTEDRRATRPTTRLAFRLFLGSMVAAVSPVAVATTRAVRDGWIPLGDNALFVIRARDLFTHHLPLLGTYSSASLRAGTRLNHPGPLYFDVLAVPARLVDSGAGIAVGVALVNSLCIVGIAVFAYRRGGALLGTVAMAATAALCWAMGGDMLFDPWNPHSVLLPFLLFLFLVWSLTDGDLLALPFAAAAGSLVVQTHLSYVLLVPLVGAWGVFGLVVGLRHDRRREPGAWPARKRRARWLIAVAGAVLLVCWLQPLIEQFTGDGTGNLTRLADTMRDSNTETIGFSLGTRIVATIVALPPWWFRPSMREAFISGWDAPSAGLAALSMIVLAAVLAWCAWDRHRRRDRVAFWAIGTAGFGLLTALITAGVGPVTIFGLSPHTFRWLWPLGAFVFFAVVAAFVRRLAHGSLASTRAVGVFALVALAVAAFNMPRTADEHGADSQQYGIPATRELEHDMEALEGQGALLIDDIRGGTFGNPYAWAVVAELQRRGIPFVTRDPGILRQLGPTRRFNGNNAKAELLLRQAGGALEAPPGSHLVARGTGLPATDQRALTLLKAQISDYMEQRGVQLTARGWAALEAGELPTLASSAGQAPDVAALFATRELDVMIRERYLELDDTWAKRFTSYADLQHEWDQRTVALFVRPISSAERSRA